MTAAVVQLPLAHAGAGATWQALLTLLSLGIAVVVLLVAAGVIKIQEPGDLVLPFAGVAVLASLSGATSSVLSDWIGWAFPIGVVAAVLLTLAAVTPLELTLTAPALWGGVVVAALGGFVLQGPITRAWHPTPTPVVASAPVDDLNLTIVSPDDGATVPAGDLTIQLSVTGGTIGPGFVAAKATAPRDPEERVVARIFVDGLRVSEEGEPQQPVRPVEGCESGCTTASYTIPIPPGEHSIIVDLMTADERPFVARADKPTSETITITAE